MKVRLSNSYSTDLNFTMHALDATTYSRLNALEYEDNHDYT